MSQDTGQDVGRDAKLKALEEMRMEAAAEKVAKVVVDMEEARKAAQEETKFEEPEKKHQPSEATQRVIKALKELTGELEKGNLGDLDFLLVIPKLTTGDMPMLFLGDAVPNIMLEGLLHRMLTKMSVQS